MMVEILAAASPIPALWEKATVIMMRTALVLSYAETTTATSSWEALIPVMTAVSWKIIKNVYLNLSKQFSA